MSKDGQTETELGVKQTVFFHVHHHIANQYSKHRTKVVLRNIPKINLYELLMFIIFVCSRIVNIEL